MLLGAPPLALLAGMHRRSRASSGRSGASSLAHLPEAESAGGIGSSRTASPSSLRHRRSHACAPFRACGTSWPAAATRSCHRHLSRSAHARSGDRRSTRPGKREDRDHRLGDRPPIRSSIRRATRCLSDSPRAAALHDREGDRRACVRAEERDRRLAARRVRGRRLQPGRTWRASRPGTPTPRRRWRPKRRASHRAYLGNYKVFVETTLWREPQRETRPRSWRQSKVRLRTGWTSSTSPAASRRSSRRHRRARARRTLRARRRRPGGRSRERVQRLRRGVGLVLPTRTGDRGGCRRDRRQPDDANPRRVRP